MRGEGGIAEDFAAFEQFLDLTEMILANDMRGDDQLPLRMLVKIFDKDLLIRQP